jgi:pyruvate,water dikinase
MNIMSKAPTKFPSPYDLRAPAAAEGWERLYPYYLRFQDNLKAEEEAKFWFCDSQHWPQPFKPFDAVTVEFACKCLGQYNTRHYIIPPANGVDYRIHLGYCYMSPVAIAPELIAARVPHFLERAGHYFQNWDALLKNWDSKVRANIADLEAIHFEPLPDMVPLAWVKDGVGLDNTYAMMETYDRLIQLLYKTWQYHFEFLNLGYAAYLDFFGFLKEQFPSIPDQAIAKMVQGVDVDLFRPDDELKKLAKLAVELGITGALRDGPAQEVLGRIGETPAGQTWLAAWTAAQDPWFNFTSGNGFYSTDKYWIEHLDIPLGYVRDYISRLEAGQVIDRPTAEIAAERDRITAEYSDLLNPDVRSVFEAKLGLARTVFPYVENHNFYIEHWSMGVFWRKMRELGALLSAQNFWADPYDIFYLNRQEVRDALFDYGNGWGVGANPIGPHFWPAEIESRKHIMAALATQSPQPALNEPPAVITEPFTIMLWGITSESIAKWLDGAQDASKLSGMAASPGVVEGRARVVVSADDLGTIEEGEILITRVTAPSWAPVFGKIRATVTDIGGMMSHAAIVCREYGLPAVTGTGNASTRIKTGDMLRVDGSTGEVMILAG